MSHLRTVRRQISDEQVRGSITRILRGNVLCSISTVTPQNRAHINTAYFCYSSDLELSFLSDPSSLHCGNLTTNPSMGVAVFSSSQKWGNADRGMQLFGRCHQARGRQAEKAEHRYGRRFPLYAKVMAGMSREEQLQASQLRSYRFYRFLPRSVKILDERAFGGGVFVVASVRRRRPSK